MLQAARATSSAQGLRHTARARKRSESHREPKAEALECRAEMPGGLILGPKSDLILAGSEPVCHGWARPGRGHNTDD